MHTRASFVKFAVEELISEVLERLLFTFLRKRAQLSGGEGGESSFNLLEVSYSQYMVYPFVDDTSFHWSIVLSGS